jgi:hypothetical protein
MPNSLQAGKTNISETIIVECIPVRMPSGTGVSAGHSPHALQPTDLAAAKKPLSAPGHPTSSPLLPFTAAPLFQAAAI